MGGGAEVAVSKAAGQTLLRGVARGVVQLAYKKIL